MYVLEFLQVLGIDLLNHFLGICNIRKKKKMIKDVKSGEYAGLDRFTVLVMAQRLRKSNNDYEFLSTLNNSLLDI